MHLLAGTMFDRPPHCARCDQLESQCRCPPEVAAKKLVPPEKQIARFNVEKRKKGKLVTVVRGLTAANNDLPKLLTHLKNACGAGGTIEADEIELQGDQTDRLKRALTQLGYQVR